MNRIRYDINLMKFMQLFESLTKARLKDCIGNVDKDQLIFIVEENEIGKAIGKGGSNVKRMEGLLNKKIKIVDFNPDVRQFIRNFVMPLQVQDVNEENNVITITGPDTKTKGLLIGRDRKNLENLKSVVKRYFEVEDIKVI